MRGLVASLLLVASSCSSPTSPAMDYWDSYPWSPVRITGPSPTFSAFLAPLEAPQGFFGSVLVVTNTTHVPIQLHFGPCDFGLRLYSNDIFVGSPSWDNRPPGPPGCDAILLWLEIPPGETRTKPVFGFVNPTTLADSLPSGTYYAAVTWRSSPAGRVHLVPAGKIRLSSNLGFE